MNSWNILFRYGLLHRIPRPTGSQTEMSGTEGYFGSDVTRLSREESSTFIPAELETRQLMSS